MVLIGDDDSRTTRSVVSQPIGACAGVMEWPAVAPKLIKLQGGAPLLHAAVAAGGKDATGSFQIL